MKTTSWVIIDCETGKPILETFNEKLTVNLKSRFVALPILQWLLIFNTSVRQ